MKDQIFNLVLAKVLGFYQMIDPKTEKFLGRYNIYRCIFVLIFFINCLISIMASLNGLYYWSNNTIESILYFGIGLNFLYYTFKFYFIFYNSKKIWDCLFITQFNFTTHARRDRRILDLWRKRSIRITYMTTTMFFSLTIIYIVYPLILSDIIVVLKNHDDGSSKYRLNILNLYSFIPEQTYNTHFNVFYIIELVGCICCFICVINFEFILISMTLAISCQLEMICAAFKSVAHEPLQSSNVNSINNEIKICNGYNLDVFTDLKTIIIDHQRVLKKYDLFLKIFQWIILLDIFVLSSSIILFTFIFIMCAAQERFAEMILMKSNLAVSFTIQLFIKCYLFDKLHNKKDSIIFAVYCSNWTEMNMKCKKLILLIMKMNNAHNQRLKFTTTRFVNLEMFYKTMRTCYTIISVLLNCVKQKSPDQ